MLLLLYEIVWNFIRIYRTDVLYESKQISYSCQQGCAIGKQTERRIYTVRVKKRRDTNVHRRGIKTGEKCRGAGGKELKEEDG